MSTIILITTATITVLAIAAAVWAIRKARSERSLSTWLIEQRDEQQARAAELEHARLGAERVGLLERFTRRTVVVNSVDGTTGWRGVLREELEDGLLLEACELLERDAAGRLTVSSLPGDVGIPAGKILYVQAERDT